MTIRLASGHYFLIETDVPTDTSNTQTLHDKAGGSGLLHANLRGVVANDVTYITNAFLPDATQNPGNVFKVDALPDGFSNVVLRARWKWSARQTAEHFTIGLYQGKPTLATGGVCSDGIDACIVEIDWSSGSSFGDFGYVLGTWNDLVLPVDESLITDRTDLWIYVNMSRHPNQGVPDADRAVEQLSWLVLQCDFPFSSVGEAPAEITKVNGLEKASPVLSNVGASGFFRYCYRVVPIGPGGSGLSDEVSIENSPVALDSTDKICLTWDDVEGATSYKVYRTCAPTGIGIGLIATVLPDLGDCGGGGGSGGNTGMEDDGTVCPNAGDCTDTRFSEALCQGVTTITYPAKETPS